MRIRASTHSLLISPASNADTGHVPSRASLENVACELLDRYMPGKKVAIASSKKATNSTQNPYSVIMGISTK
jgi:hypothetical protein